VGPDRGRGGETGKKKRSRKGCRRSPGGVRRRGPGQESKKILSKEKGKKLTVKKLQKKDLRKENADGARGQKKKDLQY